MKSSSRRRHSRAAGLAWILVAALGTTACDHLRGGHDHSSDHGTLTLNDGQKWPTDAPLREAMSKLKTAVDAVAEGEAPSAEAASRVADAVKSQVSYMLSNCKLEPKADGVLHVLIADLMKGADEVGAVSTRTTGIDRIRAALKAYPQHFSPAWQATLPR